MATVTDSILDSTKKVLGLDPDYDVFDQDILMHINSVFTTLNQLGVGPKEGFAIAGSDETWDTFLGNDFNLNSVKSYVQLRVRMMFDPPATSFTQQSFKEQIKELEWRLNIYYETSNYETSTVTPTINSSSEVPAPLVDGGGA